jgi:Brp/Blh family beta-carotene 15,15'-monooxygenase
VYAVAVVLAFFIFLLLPSWTLAGFLLLSGIHFGLADARELDQRTGVRSPRALWVSSAVLRGSLLIALPFASRPSASLAVFADVLHLVGRPPAAPWNAEQVGTLATLVLVAVSVGLLLLTAARLRQSQRRTAARELLETMLLGGAFLLLHPLFAIGFYVLAWHSWRHMGPLLRFFQPEAAPSSRAGLVRRIAWLHVQALPLLVPTWAIFAAVAWWQIGTWDPSRLAALTVATFAVVTLPHHLLVEAMLGRIDPPAERLSLERC